MHCCSGPIFIDRDEPSPNEPSVETLEQVAEPEGVVGKETGMFDCAIEGEGQGSWMDLTVAAP